MIQIDPDKEQAGEPAPPRLLKDLFTPELVTATAFHLKRHLSDLDAEAFAVNITGLLGPLELKQRAQLIADYIHAALPADPQRRDAILRGMLHPDETGATGRQSDSTGLSGWAIMPLTLVVGQYGLDDFDGGMALLREMTKRFSSEFAIRYFLIADQDRALTLMQDWARDPNHHVRRLASEGSRPRLPWAMRLPKLIADPTPALSILDVLRDDSSDYVRRSVANHLNDIAKDHPDLVSEIAARWLPDAGPERRRLVRHACRTLIKAGHVGTLEAFGLGAPQINLESLALGRDSIALGETLEFSAAIVSTASNAQTLIVDYVVDHMKANGRSSPKVFKWTQMTLAPGERRVIRKAHPMRMITTRKYHSGRHGLSLRINGQRFGAVGFDLATVPATDR